MSAESPSPVSIVTVADIRSAALRLNGIADHTPLLESPGLSRRLGGRVLFKAEGLQSVGSFKIRGAHNMISQLPPDVRARGVVAFSSGNHAQAVAAVAAYFKIPAVIVMPTDAPAAKIEGTRARGAEIVLYDRLTEDREAIGRQLGTERGATLVPPFDDPRIIAGQGTVGLEIASDCEQRGIVPNLVLVPCSGGGLVAGVATAVKIFWPDIAVIACEPERYDDTARSLAADRLIANTATTPSICDALMVNTPGQFTFAINRMLLSEAVAVSDAWVMAAMKTAKIELNLMTEPGGAIGLAALLSHKVTLDGRTAVVVLSGSNVDRRLFDEALAAADPT